MEFSGENRFVQGNEGPAAKPAASKLGASWAHAGRPDRPALQRPVSIRSGTTRRNPTDDDMIDRQAAVEMEGFGFLCCETRCGQRGSTCARERLGVVFHVS